LIKSSYHELVLLLAQAHDKHIAKLDGET